MSAIRYTFAEFCAGMGPSGAWVSSSHGERIYPLDPGLSDWDWTDVARGLANECRYGGQGSFYSVAEHSCKVARLLRYRGETHEVELAGLLHDAPEALGLRDMQRPLKVLPEMKWYRDLDARWTRHVLERAGLPGVLPDAVHRADRDIIASELRHAFPAAAARIPDLPPDPPGLDSCSWCWSPARAEEEFLILLDHHEVGL